MRRVLRWVKRLVIAVIALAALVIGVIYALSERVLNRGYDVEGRSVAVPADAASLDEGRRLARIRGCDGCHEADFAGGPFFDPPFPMNLVMGRVSAPDLTMLAASRTEAELERGIRQGVDQEGRSVLAMPSEMFQHMSDDELGKIIAAIRSAPAGTGAVARKRLGPMVRFLILQGEFYPAATAIDHSARPPETTPTDPMELGEYIARGTCAECHGADLFGTPANPAMVAVPALSKVMAYTREQFATLMREGVPLDGRVMELMDDMATERFARLTDDELFALYAYLSNPGTWEGIGQ